METTKSKTNDELRVTEDHRPLADSELDAVSGGFFTRYVMPTAKIEDPHKSGGWIMETER
jgi:hypothetical protein